MRDLPCPARISCRLGSGFQRTQNNQPPGNADAVFDVSIRGPALDRPARRADAAHDFSERPRAREHVSPVLSGFTPWCRTRAGTARKAAFVSRLGPKDRPVSITLAAPGLGFSPKAAGLAVSDKPAL